MTPERIINALFALVAGGLALGLGTLMIGEPVLAIGFALLAGANLISYSFFKWRFQDEKRPKT